MRVATSIASLLGIYSYRRWLRDVPIKQTLFWCSLVSAPLGLTQLALVYRLNLEWGIPDGWFTLGDDLILTVLGQLAFMPILVLAAGLCPPGVEGTLFATLMSIFNGAGALGSQLGALLTDAFHVTETDFTNLGPLVAVCNLSSLPPLLAIGWLDAAPAAALRDPESHLSEASTDATRDHPEVEPKVVDVEHVDDDAADGPSDADTRTGIHDAR